MTATHGLRWHITRDTELEPPRRTLQLDYRPGVRPGSTAYITRPGDRPPDLGITGEPRPIVIEVTFNSDEAAARYYIEQLLGRDARPGVRRLVAPETPRVLPDLRLVETYPIPSTETTVLRFQQYHADIPVFGARVVVELDSDRKARAVTAEIAEVGDAPSIATLSVEAAITALARQLDVPAAAARALAPPTLTFFEDRRRRRWHLAFLFMDVPLSARPRTRDHGMAPSPRSAAPRVNCLVEATRRGRILFSYGSDPTAADVPVELRGLDESDNEQEFWGSAVDGEYLLIDPQRNAQTYDLAFGDVVTATPPTVAVAGSSGDWGSASRAAVSAHTNGALVLDFYNAILRRDGVDGRSMPLVSLVNCLYGVRVPGRTDWANAVWYKERMWYGQVTDKALGRLVSHARYLDIIAHELTHGVTKYTAGLVYSDEPGALNESISDIFGVIVRNWDWRERDGGTVDTWIWQIGPGLGKNGGPLRDLQDPTRTGKPDHMDNYLHTRLDYGGVHTNSNIHNKAAYNVITAVDESGGRIFKPIEVAQYYYWALQRLGDRDGFVEMLAELVDVVSSAKVADAEERDRMVTAIRTAYAYAGIVLTA